MQLPMSPAPRILALALALAAPLGTPAAAEPVSLFDGKSFAGWDHDSSHWSIEDGALTGTIPDGEELGRNLFLFWDGEIHDFELHLDFRVTGHPSANSGVQFRSLRTPDGSAEGYQADLDNGDVWLGRIYDEHGRGLIAERGAHTTIGPDGTRATVAHHDPKWVQSLVDADGWNQYTIRAVGPRMETFVNGEPTTILIDHETGQQDFSGALALQLHSGPGPVKIQFKNFTLTDLGKTHLPASASAPASPSPDGRPGIEPTAPDGSPLNLGFESGTLDGWTATGTAWEGLPVKGNTVTPRRGDMASEHVGEFWAGGYEPGHSDAPQGTLTSDPFEVTHPFASFLVGGGNQRETRVEIVRADSGQTVHSASGEMRENLAPSLVDLSAHLGEQIQIKVIDESSGHWGHVNYDDFRFHDEAPASLAASSRPSRLRTNPILQHLTKNPAAPEASTPALANVANTYLPEGFEAHLIAAEPDVRQPIAFTTDARGRLWVAEAFSYPQRQPEGEGKDRITIFADSDGDGIYETRTVFAENLNLISGLEVGFGGVWVGAAPHLLFIPDRDGDDVPDSEPEILLDGWGYQDTHETPNSFIWGPDGWLYGNQGVFNTSLVGKPGTPDAERTALYAAVWRYHPTRHRFEVFAHGGSNQWGLDFDRFGEAFMTHCRSFWGGGPTTHVILRGHYWNQSNSRHAPFVSNDHPPHAPHLRNFMLASAQYGHGEGGAGKEGSRALYGGHSHVGTMIYQGTNWPAEFRDGLFTHNLHGHQINHQRNRDLGSGYETIHAGLDFAFVDAPDYIAVDLKANHDGAVYLIDWADTQHCHSPHMERWDRSDGRIVRIAYAETYQPTMVNFHEHDDATLADLVTSENEWSSRTARRLLQERAAGGSLDRAIAAGLAVSARSDSAEHALRALWALHLTGTLEPESIVAALGHPHPRVRAWMIRLTTEEGSAPGDLFGKFLAMANDDTSPVVRLALASYLADAPAAQVWPLATALAAHGEDHADRNLPKMIYFGIAPHFAENPERALAFAEQSAQPHIRDFARWYLAKNPAALPGLIGRLGALGADPLRHELATLRFALGAAPVVAPGNWATTAPRLYAHSDDAIRADARHLGAIFSDEPILADLRRTLADPEAPEKARRHAFETLSRMTDRLAFPTFLALLDDPAFRAEVIPLLARYDEPSVGPALIHALSNLPDQERSAAIDTLIARPSTATLFLEALKAGDIDRQHLTAVHIRQLRNLGNPSVTSLAADLFGVVRETAADKMETIASLTAAYQEAPLWVYSLDAGKAVFDQVCASCHAINGEGGPLGPDLAGSGNNGLEYFLEGIIDPNAVVGTDFQLTLVTKSDGAVIAGVLEEETAESLTLRTLTEPLTIPASEVASRQRLESSLMPEGLLATLTERQQLELLKFLTSLR
ncbi:hypothetical protein BH23VER1_BH23VER1_07060 [soil metagenome]